MSGRPQAVERIPTEKIVEVDVREDLRSGREPFQRIMSARRDVPEGGALCLRAIFEPVPLYGVMANQGLTHYTEQLGPEDWRVWFYPESAAGAESEAGAPGESAEGAGDGQWTEAGGGGGGDRPDENLARGGGAGGAGDVVLLDVRGLEAPEPMVRTLTALESLPPGATLVQINVRVPRFLLPQLEERGFSYEVREQGPDLVRLFIRHARAPRGD